MALSAWLGRPGSQQTGRPQQAEKSDGAIGRPEMPEPTKVVPVNPLLAEIVEQITDWDVPDANVARAMAPKAIPTTTPQLIVQYRVPIRSDRHFGSAGYKHRQYGHVVTAHRTGVVTIRPSGPLGVLLVSLKPEAAARLLGDRMQEFIDEKINLSDLFNTGQVSLLEEMLMEAPDSATRFARIESFLLRHLRQRQPDFSRVQGCAIFATKSHVACAPACSAVGRWGAAFVAQLSGDVRGQSEAVCTRRAHREGFCHAAGRISLGGNSLCVRLCRPGTHDQRFRRHCRRDTPAVLPPDRSW